MGASCQRVNVLSTVVNVNGSETLYLLPVPSSPHSIMSPGSPKPAGGPKRKAHYPICRMPGCNYPAFVDGRVNERREWCSNEHMQSAIHIYLHNPVLSYFPHRAAIVQRVEEPCSRCRVWPRRTGHRLCSGTVCRYPYFPPSQIH